jgi:5-methylcytosine-specific restriction endonuclease McrA
LKLYPKYNPETYINKEFFAEVCKTGDLRPVWAKNNSVVWGVEYEPYLALCKPSCSCCGSKLNYGLGKNNPGKKDYETPSTDHIIPKSEGGADSIDNFWIICERCNRMKNNATYEDVERFKRIAQVLAETKNRH